MEVERAVVDLYRTFVMKDRIGERFEGTVTAVVGSGLFVQLDSPFVDVLVRLEDLGHDRWEVDDDGLRVVATRSGDVVALGDRLVLEIVDASILRRTVYARRVGARMDRDIRDGARGGPRIVAPELRKPKTRAATRQIERAPRKGRKMALGAKKKGKKRR
jgi:ribonuclease R